MAAILEKGRASRQAVWVMGALLFALAAGAFVGIRTAMREATVLPGVRLAGVALGGLTYEETRQVLADKLASRLHYDVLLNWGQGQQSLKPADAGISLAVDELATQALAVGRQGSLARRWRDRLQLWRKGYDMPYQLTTDKRFTAALSAIRKKVDKPAINARFQVEPDGDVTAVGGETGLAVDMDKLRHDILTAALSLERQIRVAVRPVQPEVSAALAREWGIKKVVASFTTKFNAADVNRTQNIRIAAQALNGALIGQGETFSFNKRVGPRAARLGYLEAPVVVGGELVPDIGGGVCQVSSTLYNAVLSAGLRVDTRVPHSIPSTYVELGRDATVAYDYIDFRFVNTTRGNLLIQTQVSGNRLEIMLLGTEPAPKIRLVSRVESTTPAPVVEIADSSLAPGKKVVEDKGGQGYVVSVWRVVGEEPAARWELVGKTTYKARPTVYRVGPGGGAGTAVPAARSQPGRPPALRNASAG